MCRIVLAALLLVSGAASAATHVQGQISSDTTWTLAGSPYMLTGKGALS